MHLSRTALRLTKARTFIQSSRTFAASTACAARAVIYTQNGDPAKVLSVLTYPSLSTPQPNTVNIKFLLSPVNPADINVVEGVYPSKPNLDDSLALSGKGSKEEPVFVGGNEGLAQVTAVGTGVNSLSVNDWVIMAKQQSGTWSTDRNVAAADVVKVPNAEGLSEAHAATITVNPATAYNMLSDFVELKEGDWVIQNGANSAVGQAVIQIAASRSLKTINLVRNRESIQQLEKHLYNIGATHVLTYDDLADKSTRDKIKSWTGGKNIRLGLNCVGGKETTMMARLLGMDAHLVSYGAMSKQPLSLPTSLFIFKNLTSHGFWQSRWYKEKLPAERENLLRTLVTLITQRKLNTADHCIITIDAESTDDEASDQIRSIMAKIAEGHYGKKVLLKIEDDN